MESRPAESTNGSGPHEVPQGYGPVVAEEVFQGPGLLQVIWLGRWIVLGVTLLALMAGFVYLSKATPIYESTSRVYVEKEGPMIISRDEGGVMTQSRNYLYTQAEFFKSLEVLGPAVEKLEKRNLRTFMGVDNKAIFLKASCLEVDVGKKDEIISVSARSPYPVEAAWIVNDVVKAYWDTHKKKKKTATGELLDILKEDRKALDTELENKRQAVIDFKDDAGVLLFETEEQNPILREVSMLWDLLTKAKLETMDARIAYEALKEASGSAILRKELIPPDLQNYLVAAEQEFQRERRQLAQEIQLAQESLRGLKGEFTEATPSVRMAKARIQRQQEDLRTLEKGWAERESQVFASSLEAARQRYEVAKEKEAGLDREARRANLGAQNASAKQTEYALLVADLRRSERFWETLDDRIREIDVSGDTGALNISILDVAEPGTTPVSPQRTRIMAIALVLGLMLGVGLAFLRDMMNKRLRSSDEMSAVLAAPVLGVLPHMKDAREVSMTGKRVHMKPDSITAEAYRTVRTAIYYNAMNKEEKAKVLLLTSPTSGDGKSTVTSNLAISMAQVGQKVLVLDFDLRRSVQHKIFQINGKASGNGASLPGVLAGETSVDSLIHPTGIDGLDVLPNLTRISNPGEIINSPAFADLLRELAQKYDQILIDSPPVMPVADARVLAVLCDATIVVLRAEKSTRKVTELTREGLESVGARILGIAINDVPKSKGGHGHYYGYYGVSRYYRYDNYREEEPRRRRRTTRRKQAIKDSVPREDLPGEET